MNKVRILGFAPVPAFPREARKAFKLAVALVLSLVASVVAALFVEGLDHTVSRREEVEERLRVPYLASIGIHQE
jgi:capsular polysaccharide biosynthesis protein